MENQVASMMKIEEGDPFRKVIIKTLQENDWDVYKSIEPLFIIREEERVAKRRKEREEKLAMKKKEENEKPMQFLGIMFDAFTPAEILRVLEKNDGDVDATTEHFLQVVQKKSEKKSKGKAKEEKKGAPKKDYRELQRERERKFLTDSLCQRFSDFSREHIVKKLKAVQWDSDKAIESLLADRSAARNLRFSKIIERATEPMDAMPTLSAPSSTEQARERDEVKQMVAQQRGRVDAAALFKQELEKTLRGPYSDQLAMQDSSPSPSPMGPTEVSEPKLTHPAPRPKPPSSRKTPTKKDFQATTKKPATVKVLSEAKEAGMKVNVVTKQSEVVVQWEKPAGSTYSPSFRDFIAMYKEGNSNANDKYDTWKSTWGTAKGEVSFNTSSISGQYVFKYMGSAETTVAVSSVVQIGPLYSIHVNKPQNQNTMPMEVSVLIDMSNSLENDFPASSWIALYEKTDKEHRPDSRSYTSFKYVTSTSQLIESEMKDGSSHVVRAVPFTIPKAGVFEIRFFPTKAYDSASQLTLNLTGQDKVQLAKKGDQMIVNVKLSTVDPTQESVWVGIFHSKETNVRQYRRYKYVASAGVTTIQFKACIHTGDYEARLLTNRGSDVLATSSIVHVDGIEGGYWL
jgi:hypothetical protein